MQINNIQDSYNNSTISDMVITVYKNGNIINFDILKNRIFSGKKYYDIDIFRERRKRIITKFLEE